MDPVKGSCLCGAVHFEITGRVSDIGMCHCSKCRKVSGVASNAQLMTGRDSLRFTKGEDDLTRFELPDGWGQTRCGVCGSPVPMQHPNGKAWWVPAGLLDTDPGVPVAGHIYVGSKAPWDEIAGDGPRFEEGFDSRRVG